MYSNLDIRRTMVNYYIYILKSKIISKTYVGYTSDIQKRLKEHNSASNKYTSKFKPWELFYTETFDDKQQAC
ncbi:MAG: hypothetical protein ACD_58C00258G0001, partial [uncultured bacterium]